MDQSLARREEVHTSLLLLIATVVGAAIFLEWSNFHLQPMIVALFLFFTHHVTPYYDSKALAEHFFWLNTSVVSARLIESFAVGCLVAWSIRGRELAAAISLSFVSLFFGTAVFWLLVATHQPVDPRFFPSVLVQQLGVSCTVTLGGLLVHHVRAAKTHRL